MRCATSRAYYSAYHKAISYLEYVDDRDWRNTEGSHQKVIEVLNEKHMNGVASNLGRLKDFRKHHGKRSKKTRPATAARSTVQ